MPLVMVIKYNLVGMMKMLNQMLHDIYITFKDEAGNIFQYQHGTHFKKNGQIVQSKRTEQQLMDIKYEQIRLLLGVIG